MREKIQSKGNFNMLCWSVHARALGHNGNFPVLLMNDIHYPRGNLINFHLLHP